MGQFLGIGLATDAAVAKKEIEKAGIEPSQLEDAMRHQLRFVPEIYTRCDTDDYYGFELQSDIFHSQLIPLLETLYPLLYDEPVYYQSILQKLATSPPEQWVEWAKEKPKEAFQADDYGMSEWLGEGFHRARVNYSHILLSMEGKIAMEVFGRQFRFFKYTMMSTFKAFPLAGALRVYISG